MSKWKAGNQPITHRMKYCIKQFAEMKASGLLKGKFKKPNELTIVTCHDYKELPIFEENLQFLGITDYVVLRDKRKPWKNVYKIEQIYNFLETAKRTNYVLFCDARDVIIRDDPQKIINIFEKSNCDLLFNSSQSSVGWGCMPNLYAWNRAVFKKGRYLNSGVFIGKWDFTLRVLKEALTYVTLDSVTPQEYNDWGRGKFKKMLERFPDYPKGAQDQDIFRYVRFKFHPRMWIDYKNELCYRN